MDSAMKVSDILRNEIEKTKEHIKETDLHLRKYNNTVNNLNSGNGNAFGMLKGSNQISRPRINRGIGESNFDRRRLDRPPLKRHLEEEQYEEELPNKPSLLSAVGTTIGDLVSREDVLKQQSNDTESKGRNRRMFGLLLGTLNQFRVDEKGKTNQMEKRKMVEEKVQLREREEREKMRRQKGKIFSDKRAQETKLRGLIAKMEIVELHEEWEHQCTSLKYFIRTSARPNIFYLPKSHTAESLEKLQQSEKTLMMAIAKRRKQLEEDVRKLLDDEDDNQVAVDDGHRGDGRRGDEEDKKENASKRRQKEHRIQHEKKKRTVDKHPHSDLEDGPQHHVAIDYDRSPQQPVAAEITDGNTVHLVDEGKRIKSTERDDDDTQNRNESADANLSDRVAENGFVGMETKMAVVAAETQMAGVATETQDEGVPMATEDD